MVATEPATDMDRRYNDLLFGSRLAAIAVCNYSTCSEFWRVRLVVRTQPSQGWCTGSTPVRAAVFRFS